MPVYLPGLTFGSLGYGGSPYGVSSYGSKVFSRLPVAPTGGYGGAPYGTSSYGSLDVTPPYISSASSLDGFRVEIFFTEELRNDAALTDPSNYIFTDLYGVPLTTISVAGGTPGSVGGYTSVIATHSGSTLGGSYQVSVINVRDIAGNVIGPTVAQFSALGDTTQVDVSLPTPDDGRTVRLDFKDSRGLPQNVLTEVEFSPGVDDVTSYNITTSYLISPTIGSATQSSTLLSQVDLDVHPMTSTTYNLVIGPSTAFDYDGTVLPDVDPEFSGLEIGTGSSAATPTDGLILSKAGGVTYGWAFRDITGRIIVGSSYRADFEIDASISTIVPPLFGATLGVLSASDGAIQIDIALDDVAGVKVLSITSGALSLQAPANWDSGPTTISLIRNQRGGFYTVLLDGVPLLTFAIASATGGAVYAPGTAVVLGVAHAVSLFALKNTELTASSTVYTDAWNFIHGLATAFTGSGALAVDSVRTKYGPLVRGWGDNTPATKTDVEVRVNGTAVAVAGVNPYIGEIYPVIPIPRAAPGVITVDIDYIWFSNPSFGMVGLNTQGLNLNTWDRAVGHTSGALSPMPSSSQGAMRQNRFPMGITLPLSTRPSPKQIGHRYIGFQRDYSALLNEPTTLLLNQNPQAISVGNVSASALEESGSFDGATLPGSAETPWTLSGVDTGGVVGDGTYRVVDASSGPYETGTAAVWSREVDLSLPTMVLDAGRFLVESYTAEGVFTGVAFGVHDGDFLFLVGALIVNGVQHLGALLDASNPHLAESWEIGPALTVDADSSSSFEIDYEDLPPGIVPGSRFRIAEGSQAGVYTIDTCGLALSEDGTTVEITFSPDLPADINLFGNGSFEVFFETSWESLVSLRAQIEVPDGTASVYLGGVVSGLLFTLDALPAYPAQTALLLPATEEGVAFWGSLSRRATNSSVWDFTRYASNPERLTSTVQGLTVQTEMNVTPPNDPNDPWYIVGGFGYAEVDVTGNYTLIKSTSGSEDESIDLEFSFERVEPYLSNKVTTDTEAMFQVESGILGAGDMQVVVRDGVREVRFASLLYTQSPTLRELVTDLPQASLSGLISPVVDGWSVSSAVSFSLLVRGQTFEISKESSETGLWSKSLPDPVSVDYQGLICEASFQVESGSVVGTGGIGVLFGADVPISGVSVRRVYGSLGTGTIDLRDSGLALVASIAFNWDDGETHTYRLLCDPNADIVVVVVDDVVLGNAALSAFSSGAGSATAYFGALGTGSCDLIAHSTSVVPLRPMAVVGSTLGRTFGILLRTGVDSPDDIDSYRIPRADVTSAPNSSTTAIPVLMDWQSWVHARLYLDPTWGVSFYRPDIPLPPWATGDFATQTTNVTGAWCTVEYALLPVVSSDRGGVIFGAPDRRSITQQRWDFMRYRIRGDINGFGIAPQGMVLNRAFTMKSGEFLQDMVPETVTINSRTSTLVYVPDSAIYADRVFVVQVDGSVLPSTAWGFDQESQNLILTSALPGTQYPVTVTFAVGFPITQEYLCSQPIESSVTLLNEGTPPMPMSRDEAVTSSVALGALIDDPTDVLDAAEALILTDPHRFIEFTAGASALYVGLEFCEVEDGDDVHLSSLCDGPGPGQGLAEIGIEGEFTTDRFTIEGGPGGPWKNSGSPVVKGSVTHFSQTSILLASGGGYVDGNLGPGTAIMYPNARGPSGEPPPGGMGMNQDFRMLLVDVTPRSDLMDIPSLLGDNVPPSSADPTTDPNADGAPGVQAHGACAYIMEDWAATTWSKLGPWGGITVLSTDSLLAGGTPLPGDEFILNGGSPIAGPTITSGTIEAAN
jgi:hypothetical protein